MIKSEGSESTDSGEKLPEPDEANIFDYLNEKAEIKE